MKNKKIYFVFFLFASAIAAAQVPVIRSQALQNLSNIGQNKNTSDSLRRRNNLEDSITIRFYFLDSSRGYKFDSSIRDFTKRFPIPGTNIYLGNTGSASKSLLFSPLMKAGWDPGFHELDAYRWKLENVRFYNTTRPYTELGYTLASRAEQIIEILHTQNVKPYWNLSFQYRLINAPGVFRNQRTNHNNYLFTSWYQSPGKRYNNYFVFLNNKLQEGESGGIKSDQDYLKDPIYVRNRFTIPSNIGGEAGFGTDFFSNALYTGRREKDNTLLMRQQYDFGRKDSIVTDSTVIPLFYPRLRFEHTFKLSKYDYVFQDFPIFNSTQQNTPDSAYYITHFNLSLKNDSALVEDRWSEVSNDFSFYQFPDAKNLQQFIKLGAEIQLLSGSFKNSSNSFHNFIAHGEYRNRTKNQKWDMIASGRLYLNGFNGGDYHAFVSLQRALGQKLGSLQIGFENINRSPSFIYNQESSFYLDAAKNFSKENTIHFFASILDPKFHLQLQGDYYVVTNYMYVTNYYKLQQDPSLFNVLRISALKTFHIGGNWNWHAELYVQQKAGSVQVNIPLAYTRNRIAFEGLLYRNLNISTGAEIRYYTPYKADSYSPVLGQFFYQDSVTISNRPQLDAFLHIRIRSFKAYARLENLNTVSTLGGFYFSHNNLAAPYYPTPGLVIRFGIYWNFVN